MVDKLERIAFFITRVSTLSGVLASWLGAILMFILGVRYTFNGFMTMIERPLGEAGDLPPDEATVVFLIEALDRFLIAVVLLYFGYGLYGLFIRPHRTPSELGLPAWLHVDRIGELKQTVAEVIIVILFVLFLRIALEAFHSDAPDLSFASIGRILLLPVCILLLALALRFAELHPKRDIRRKSDETPGRGGDVA